jgi:hypothetical protein
MKEPPFLLDAARVIEYAPLDHAVRSVPGAHAVVGGVAVDPSTVAGLVVAEGLAQGEMYLLHCNEQWETLAAGPVTDAAAARADAEVSYPGSASLWRAYRELSPEERAEIESTRAFLRELLAQDPDA